MLSAVTKQWYKILRQVEYERASTLTASRIMELTHMMSIMQRTCFTALKNNDEQFPVQAADVFLVALDRLKVLPPSCHTLYVTHKLDQKSLEQLTEKMPDNSLLVVYNNDHALQ